jgi:hypothetical protein
MRGAFGRRFAGGRGRSTRKGRKHVASRSVLLTTFADDLFLFSIPVKCDWTSNTRRKGLLREKGAVQDR